MSEEGDFYGMQWKDNILDNSFLWSTIYLTVKKIDN